MPVDNSDTETNFALQAAAVEAAYANKPNADWELLVMWADAKLEGRDLTPEFEHMATTLLVTSIGNGKLPTRSGKPTQTAAKERAKKVEAAFNAQTSGGDRREDVIAALAEKFHVDTRTIERDLKTVSQIGGCSADSSKSLIGRTLPGKGGLRTNSAILRITQRFTDKK